jgi:hypothetical protein
MDIEKIVSTKLGRNNRIWIGPEGNYWSNLNIEENTKFLQDIDILGSKNSVKKYFPEHYDIIFSPKRAAGLALLDLRPGEIVVDAGCMWGALTIPLAKAGCNVIGIDQTCESLKLLEKRVSEEQLKNVELVCSDLNKISFYESTFDKAIINGVLEWIPQVNPVELKKYYGQKNIQNPNIGKNPSPRQMQYDFLKKIFEGLKNGGALYLAIENRYDIFYFMSQPDPHCNIRLITFMPRWIQNLISNILLGRPYINWIYSSRQLEKLLNAAGFTNIEMMYAFPDYRSPEFILSKNGLNQYHPIKYRMTKNRLKKIVVYFTEELIFRRLKLKFFSPAFIVIARKVV